MTDGDEANSIAQGFTESFRKSADLGALSYQDGFEIICAAFGKNYSSHHIRHLTAADLGKMVECANFTYETTKITGAMIVEALKAGLYRWSGDDRMKNY